MKGLERDIEVYSEFMGFPRVSSEPLQVELWLYKGYIGTKENRNLKSFPNRPL